METGEYLTGPAAATLWPAVVSAVAIALPTAALSVIVVPKRLAFLGQGITHAAFGGVGIAAILGLTAGPGFVVVAIFCVLAALAIGAVTGRGRLESDTAIAVVLVGAMALGGALVHLRLALSGPTPMAAGWESLLFGSILAVTWLDAVVALVVAGGVLTVLVVMRRPLLFWAFDAPAAESFGVAVGAVRMIYLTLCAITIVTAMKLAGVVLVTALLVLPGATAMRLSARLGVVVALSLGVGLLGVLGGLAVASTTGLPAGSAIVGVQIGLLAVATIAGRAGGGQRRL